AILAAQIVQAFLVFTLLSWAGLRVGQPMGLDAPLLRAWVYRTPRREVDVRRLVLSCAIGLACGVAIIALDQAFQPHMPASKLHVPLHIERWRGFLASFYGGIGEEVQIRLFLMTM